jgi:hypothetical protein
MSRKYFVSIVMIALAGMAACTPNQPPAKPLIEASDTTVKAGSEVFLVADSDDPDGDPIYWKWEAESGTFDVDDAYSTVWTAPLVTDTSHVTVNVEASDNHGNKASSDIVLTVYPKSTSPGVEVIVGEKAVEDSALFDGASYGYYRWQGLYYGSEIAKSGAIEKIAFMPSMSVNAFFNNMKVYMVEVTREELEANFQKNYESGTPELVFFSSSLAYSATTDSWFELSLSSSLEFDSTKNLLIEISWFTGNGVAVRNWGFGTASKFRSVGSQFEDALDGLTRETVPYLRLSFEN